MEMDEEDESYPGNGQDTALEDMDEEAMMNASEDVQAAIAAKREQEEADKWEEVMEPLAEKHMPGEPTVSAMQHLTTVGDLNGLVDPRVAC